VPWKNRRFFRVLEMRGQHLEINPTGYFRKRARHVRALLILVAPPFLPHLTIHSISRSQSFMLCATFALPPKTYLRLWRKTLLKLSS